MELVEVACCAFPDGTVRWILEPDHKAIQGVVELWKFGLPADKRERYEKAGACGGVVLVKMFEDEIPVQES